MPFTAPRGLDTPSNIGCCLNAVFFCIIPCQRWSVLQELTQIECDRLVSLGRKCKRDGFKQLLEDSQVNSGGRAAFAAVKEESMPEVAHIVACIKPKLKRVRWNGPTARLQVENSHEFPVGAPLTTDDESWRIQGILPYRNAAKVSQQ